jgi:hypothetical protein
MRAARIVVLSAGLLAAQCTPSRKAAPQRESTGVRPSPPGPWAHDEAEAQRREPTLSLHVRLNGKPVADWTPQQLASISAAAVKTKKGESREGWWLAGVADTLVDAHAKVTAIRAGDQRVAVDGAVKLMLRVMRDGHYKVTDDRFETVMRDVDTIELERR